MYTSKATIEKYLGVSIDSSLDTFITLTINSVKDFIENYCGDEKFGKRVFEAPALGESEEESDVIKYFDGNDEQRLYIGDLKSITSLVVDNVSQILNEDYFLKPYNSLAEGKPYDSIELAQPDGRHGSRGKAIYVFDAGAEKRSNNRKMAIQRYSPGRYTTNSHKASSKRFKRKDWRYNIERN